MRLEAVPEPPTELDPAPPGLGTLGPWLAALAAAQGSWPPVLPALASAPTDLADWDAGTRAADRLVDGGAGLVVVRGGAAPAPALTVLGVLLHLDPVSAVGTSGGPGWSSLVHEVRDGLRRTKGLFHDPNALVTTAGAQAVAGLAGLVAQCAGRRTPVLLSPAADAVAGAVLAERVAPGTAAWVLGACTAPGGAPAAGLADLRCPVLLDLRLAGGLDLALDLLGPAVGLAGGFAGG